MHLRSRSANLRIIVESEMRIKRDGIFIIVMAKMTIYKRNYTSIICFSKANYKTEPEVFRKPRIPRPGSFPFLGRVTNKSCTDMLEFLSAERVITNSPSCPEYLESLGSSVKTMTKKQFQFSVENEDTEEFREEQLKRRKRQTRSLIRG